MAFINYITGANGFIGSNLVKRLKNVVTIPHQELATIKLRPFDNFYFISGYGGNSTTQTEPDKIIQANVSDLISIITQAKDFKSFVYLSTSVVELPVQNMYSRTKKAGEEILLSYIENYNLPITIIRPFSVTGVGEQGYRLIPTLIRAAINQTEVNMCDGTHDFIDVVDFLDGVVTLSSHQATGVYGLGNGIPYTNQQVLKIVEQVTGKKIKVNRVPQMRIYDSPDWVCHDTKASQFGWYPKKSLLVSIREMYESIKNN